MKKPYVIIHTHVSLDGKIKTVDSPKFQTTSQQYQELALYPDKQVFDIKGYLNGRTTTEDNQPLQTLDLDDNVEIPAGDFVADGEADMYYVSIDRKGVIGWTRNYVDYGNRRAHVIEVLSEAATDGYKDFLRQNDISYIIAGEGDSLDNEFVLHKLYDIFGLDRLMIGGGGVLNWSYLQEGLVDEVSLVVGPFADGDPDNPSLFTAVKGLSEIEPISFNLIEAKPLEDSAVWLHYSIDHTSK